MSELPDKFRLVDCDFPECHEEMVLRVYAAYNADGGENIHPRHARYPGAMIRACAEHVGPMMMQDAALHGSTRQWLVVAPEHRCTEGPDQ